MLELLNNYQGGLSVLINFLLTLITGFSVFWSIKSYSETKKLRELQSEPEVVIYIEPYNLNLFYLVVKNIGHGSAYNISFKVDPKLESIFGNHIKDLKMLYKGISYLGPNMQRKSFIGTMSDKIKELSEFEIEISTEYYNKYKGHNRNKKNDTFLLDFEEFIGIHVVNGDNPMDNLTNTIKKTNNILLKIKDKISKA